MLCFRRETRGQVGKKEHVRSNRERERKRQGDSTEVEKMSYERLIVIIHLFVLAVIMR